VISACRKEGKRLTSNDLRFRQIGREQRVWAIGQVKTDESNSLERGLGEP
jgi:hypothetical protein